MRPLGERGFIGRNPEAEAHLNLRAALERAQEASTEEQIQLEEFRGMYPDDTIDRDIAYVEHRKKDFERTNSPQLKEAKEYATVLEAIINEQIELNNWFGENVTTRKASDFDDIANGVDTIAEITQDTSTTHLALAIDVTYSDQLDKKLQRIKREIDDGTLTSIKYFVSGDETFKGVKSKVPLVVIGADKQQLREISQLWMERNNKELAKHPLQLQLLDEIFMQLERYRAYAEQIGRHDIATIYEKQVRIIEVIRKQKKELYRTSDADNTYRLLDQVYRALKYKMDDFDRL